MRKLFFITALLTILLVMGTAWAQTPAISIVPQPMSLKVNPGNFLLDAKTVIATDKQTAEVGKYLADMLRPATGFKLKIANLKDVKTLDNKVIILKINDKSPLKDEGYSFTVLGKWIFIESKTPAGVFYGCQTLRQLLPKEIESKTKVSGVKWSIPAVQIKDQPRYQWRGMHLDVCRHFFDKEFVKEYIDMLALHKMNRFHWHLTEDQGWRIEIKKYPKLTEIGSWRDETLIGHMGHRPWKFDGKRYGGYYTQDDIREIVEYARQRFITVVPEIELPGHSIAALTAYPELGCTGGPYKVWTRWGVSDNVYCAGKEETFKFLEDVLSEVCELFPSPYIHIGGDECPKTKWHQCPKCQARIKKEGLKNEHELQSYFITRIEKFLNSKGKRIIGWDEILEGGLAPNATVMSWRGVSGGIAAARQNHDVVMSPNSHCYFDHYQGDPTGEPLAIGGYLTLEKVYSYEPTPKELNANQAKHILGAQGNVWTEYIASNQQAEYMALPRMSALAEVVWSPKAARNWDNFTARMTQMYGRLDELHVNYRVPEPGGFQKKNAFKGSTTATLTCPVAGAVVRYTLDGSEPSKNSPVYQRPLPISKDTVLKARTFLPNGRKSPVRTGEFIRQELKKSVKVSKPNSGLKYSYYEGSYQKCPNFAKLTAKNNGVISHFIMPPKHRADEFAVQWQGYIKVPAHGTYTFFTSSDDGSNLYIDKQRVVNNDGLHGTGEVSGQIMLQKGFHAIRVDYFEAGGADSINVKYQGPGTAKQDIPANVLFH